MCGEGILEQVMGRYDEWSWSTCERNAQELSNMDGHLALGKVANNSSNQMSSFNYEVPSSLFTPFARISKLI